MSSLSEICTAIEEICTSGTPVTSSVDPELLKERAEQLLALSERLRSTQDVHAWDVPAAGSEQSPVKAEAGADAEVWPSVAARRKVFAGEGKFFHPESPPPSTRHLSQSSRSQAADDARHAAVAGRDSVWADLTPSSDSLWSQVGSAFLVCSLTLPYYICTTYTQWFVDEGFAIHRNPDAKGETPLLEVLTHDFWGTSLNPPEGYNTHKSYRPVVTLSYAAEWQLAQKLGFRGREMQPMRLLSCLVHTANALATLWLLQRLRLPLTWATICSALFATHPVHIENIVYLVGRADALATLFSLLSVLLYLRLTLRSKPYLSPGSYAALVLMTAIAGLCKEPGFTTLFFLACAEMVLRMRVRHLLGLTLSFAGVGYLRVWYVGGTEAGFGYIDTPIKYMDSKVTRTLSYLFQHAYYAKLIILPWHQSWDYSYDSLPMVHSLRDSRMLAIAAAYLAVVALAAHGLRIHRRKPSVILGLGLLLIPFVPASNLFFLVGTTIGERLLYPCTVGFALILAALAPECPAVHPAKKHMYRFVLLALLSVYIWNSNVRMSHWRSTQTLFETDALHWDRSAKVLHAQASEMQARGDLHGALDHYLKSLEVFDDQAITDYCIARILLNLGRDQEAYQRFDKILNGHGIGLHDGNDFLWMTDLGYLLVKLGSNENGIHYLQEGLKRMPYSCFAWNALGIAQANLGQLEQAVNSLMEGLQCDPDSASIWINLALVYAYGNSGENANEALQRAIKLNASNPVIIHNSRVLTGQAGGSGKPQFDFYIPLPGRR